MDYSVMPTKKLQTLAATLLDDMERNYETLCNIITELRKRGLETPKMNSGVFRWAYQVATKQLHPSTVLEFMSSSDTHLKKLCGMSIKEQKAYVNGKYLTIVRKKNNKFIEEPAMLKDLLAREVNIAFNDGGILCSIEEQKEKLNEYERELEANRLDVIVKTNSATDELIIGGYKIKTSQIAHALEKLGYVVERNARKFKKVA